MFSVCPHLGGCTLARSSGGGVPQPGPAGGGVYPGQVRMGATPVRGYLGTPSQVRMGGTPARWNGGYPSQVGGIPGGVPQPGRGTWLPSSQVRMGVPLPGGGTQVPPARSGWGVPQPVRGIPARWGYLGTPLASSGQDRGIPGRGYPSQTGHTQLRPPLAMS